MAFSVLVIQAVAFFGMSASWNSSIITTSVIQLAKGNSSNGNVTTEHKSSNKPLLLSTHPVFHNNNSDTNSSIWNLAHYTSASEHLDHFSGSSALIVIAVFIGFTCTGLFLLWRRHRYVNREVICHYTTLNQEVTLAAHDLVSDVDGDGEFHLDISDDTATSSSDDEELLR